MRKTHKNETILSALKMMILSALKMMILFCGRDVGTRTHAWRDKKKAELQVCMMDLVPLDRF